MLFGPALTEGDIVGPAIAAEDLFRYSTGTLLCGDLFTQLGADSGEIKRENVWIDLAAILQQLPQD